MVEVGNIVTLENGFEYLILEELIRDGKKYYYSDRFENEVPTDEFLIFELIKQENDEFLKIVEDKNLFENLMEEFKDVILEKAVELSNQIEAIENESE